MNRSLRQAAATSRPKPSFRATKIVRGDERDDLFAAAKEVADRARGILKNQKGIRWDVSVQSWGSSGKQQGVYIKVGPPKARWDSTWYSGSYTTVQKQDFSKANNSWDLPDAVRSVMFNLSVILPTINKTVVRFQVWDDKGNEHHLSLRK
jgi:hypothetical protein